jgi:hypothetical protein
MVRADFITQSDKEDVPFDDAKVEKDAEFLRFQKRIKISPQQIVRYTFAAREWGLVMMSMRSNKNGAVPIETLAPAELRFY